MAATTTSTGAPKLSYTWSNHRRLNPTKKLMGSLKFLIQTPNQSSISRVQRSFTIQASNNEDQDSSTEDNTASSFTYSQEDVNYLWKLGAGSVVGAAAIKYGSVIFPEITKPNIFQALFMISTPVIVAVLLLIKQSHAEQRS